MLQSEHPSPFFVSLLFFLTKNMQIDFVLIGYPRYLVWRSILLTLTGIIIIFSGFDLNIY